MAALPLELLRLPGVRRVEDVPEAQRVLAAGIPELDSILPDGGFPKGAVSEFSVRGGSALATSLALAACRTAAEEAARRGGEVPWCAFVDPSRTLHGPGVESAGVELSRLLIVQPPLTALERTAIRLVESHAFAVVIVDTLGALGASLGVSLATWPRVVRRLALAAEASGTSVLMVTDAEVSRPLPLPVALRLDLERLSVDRLSVRIAKERRGRVSGPHRIVWGKARAKVLARPEGIAGSRWPRSPNIAGGR